MADDKVYLKLQRITIRPFQDQDVADFFEYRSDPVANILQGYTPFNAIEQARDYINEQKKHSFGPAGQWIQLGIAENASDKIIGDIGMRPLDYDPRMVEIGFTVAAPFRGKGYAKEALAGLFSWLFGEKRIHRVMAITDTENHATICLLEGLGMRQEGKTLKSFWNNGAWRDEYLYALLSEEWISAN
ncbi:MAG: GNAT family N-acetyltransferase [Saprospiraceae bacterium]|nr:GNAT family N-acetyltransferase [Saprospiraceae bacterium]